MEWTMDSSHLEISHTCNMTMSHDLIQHKEPSNLGQIMSYKQSIHVFHGIVSVYQETWGTPNHTHLSWHLWFVWYLRPIKVMDSECPLVEDPDSSQKQVFDTVTTSAASPSENCRMFWWAGTGTHPLGEPSQNVCCLSDLLKKLGPQSLVQLESWEFSGIQIGFRSAAMLLAVLQEIFRGECWL